MLYRNGKQVDLTATSGEFKEVAADYQKAIKRYRQEYGKSNLCFRHKKYLNGPDINPTGIAESIPIEALPLITHKAGDSGMEEWIYSEIPLITKDGELQNVKRYELVYDGEFYIDLDKNPDFAYFMIEKHLFYNKTYVIYDTRSIAKQRADKKRIESKLTDAIYGINSPLNSNRVVLENVARRWGVMGVAEKTADEIQTELEDLVAESQKQRDSISDVGAKAGMRGIEDFLEDVKYNPDTQLGAKVMRAIEEGVVTFDYVHSLWEIPSTDGGRGQVLCTVPRNELDRKNDVLISNLLADRKAMLSVETALGEERQLEKPCELEDLEKMNNFPSMKRVAKQMGVGKESVGMKMNELREFLIEKWKENFSTQAVE